MKLLLQRQPVNADRYSSAEFKKTWKKVSPISKSKVLIGDKEFEVKNKKEFEKLGKGKVWEGEIYLMLWNKLPTVYKIKEAELDDKTKVKRPKSQICEKKLLDILYNEIDQLLLYNDFVDVDLLIRVLSKEYGCSKDQLTKILDNQLKG